MGTKAPPEDASGDCASSKLRSTLIDPQGERNDMKGLSWLLAAGVVSAGVSAIAACGGTGPAGSLGPVASGAGSVRHYTTPTPTPTPIQLQLGEVIGTPVFPEGDTSTGGQSQQVDKINCRRELLNTYHHHVHLSMFVNGEQIALPRGTGIYKPGSGQYIYHGQCFYWLHTHDATGIIHMEPPNPGPFTLKQYFDIWGEPLSVNGFAGYTGQVAVYINGTLQPGMDPTTVTFSPYEEITLVIGTPPDWIPVYQFPAGYP